tara:strand:+ start:1469 stop:2110 length:642 start_codon:yes stop_codon:yes gene_type:complete
MNSKISTLHKTVWVILLIGTISLFFTGCVVYDGTHQTSSSSYYDDYDRTPDYWVINYAPSMGMYYYNSNIYWGHSGGYYYYYGYQHIYPWWYYYQYRPPYHYATHTHVICHVGHRGYINRPNRTKRHNNRNGGSYNVNKVNTNGVTIKTNRTNIRTNTNKTNVKPVLYIPVNTNKHNVKTNTNRNNNTIKIKTNRTKTNRNTTRTKVNRKSPR